MLKKALSLSLLGALFAAAVAAGRVSASARPAPLRRPPNIVLVLLDDLGWADLGVYGSTFHRTPNIDRLAAEGLRFTEAYAAAPVCSPSRAALLTGRHPARLRLTDWLPGRRDMPTQMLLRPPIRQALPLDERTLAEALAQRGYTSASIGKWHLGGKGHEPERQGFDVNVAGDNSGTPLSYFYPFERGGVRMPGLDAGRAGEYLTDRLTDEAEKFIERHAGRPFFLYLAHFAVHIPMRAKPELVARYAGAAKTDGKQSNAIYAAMIESVDESVGRIRRKLERLGLDRDTVIIFTSDNGGLSVREGPDTPATSNAPLREGKGHLYEGGIRVPLIIFWPGRTGRGRVSRTPASGVDLFPTILEMAGGRRPRGPLDGVSLVPFFGARARRRGGALFWHYPHYSNQGGEPGGAIRQGDFKLIEFFEDERAELYDLRRDPGEKRDLAGAMPARVKHLRERLDGWRQAVGAQMMTPNPEYRTADTAARRREK